MKNLSVSFLNIAILDIHGQYSSVNIKKDTALGIVKDITLVALTKLADNAVLVVTLLQIDIVDTINSLANIPTINADTTPAELRPIGVKRFDIALEI